MSVTDITVTERMSSSDPQSFLPLTPAVLHILLTVGDDRNGKHGYAIAREVEELTDGQVAMGPGTLYGSIQRMLDSGLIEDVPRAARKTRGPDDDERRRYYRVTPFGRRVLSLELARLAAIVAVARRKQLLPA
jgi:DNA-binding PadR family transcriptional regulator